jgi:hypothetical protein
MDTVAYLYPMRMAVARQMHSGTLPLWLPNQLCGTPLAANPQVAVWYPPQLIYYLFPGAFTYGVLCILHYALGAAGTYCLTLYLGRYRAAAVFAAFTFCFGSMLVSHLALAPHLYTTVWIPWIILGLEKALRTGRVFPARSGALLAFAVSMQILAGAPQITFYTAILMAVYVVLRLLQYRKRKILLGALSTIAAAIVALLCASVQLLPAAEFSAEVRRHPIPVTELQQQALNGDMMWRALIGFTTKTIEDTDSINAIGPGALLLALIALLFRRSRGPAFSLITIGIVGWLLAYGELVPFWSRWIPLYERFHAPRRALILWSACGPIAAGIGAAAVIHAFRHKAPQRIFVYCVLAFFCLGTLWMLPRLEREFVLPARFNADEHYLSAIGNNRFITLDPGFNYAYDSRRPDYGKSLMPNTAALSNAYDAQGYDPLVLDRFAAARDEACLQSGLFYPSHGAFFSNPVSPVLRLLNVQYLIGRFDVYDPSRLIPGRTMDRQLTSNSLELVIPDKRWPLFRYKEKHPFAWPVSIVLPTRRSTVALASAVDADPYSVAYAEQIESGMEISTTEALTARYRDARTIEINFEKRTDSLQFVCIASTYEKGWRAATDTGKPLEVVPVDGVITGVIVPPGTRSLELDYAPHSFWRGLALSIAGCLLLLAMLLRKDRSPVQFSA